MNMIGEKVKHKNFGEGDILRIEENKITVRFSVGEKTFSYPKSFEHFLTVVDGEVQKTIKVLLEKQKEEEEIVKLQQEREEKEKERKEDFTTLRTVCPKNNVKIGSQLVCNLNMSYGTNSRDIYLECCERFNWHKDSQYKFGKQGCPLFAWNATPENYHVWFLCNNNWSGTKATSWENIISHDLQYIYEIWEKHLPDDREKGCRVVFAKTSDNQYVFLGVYRLSDIKIEEREEMIGLNRVFEKISSVYPFDEE